ncbi:MAG: hypothetical protein JJ992_17135, partial [Planctomycetes bacterium]|nr:hypothetical protein [Planctomycetota bacterium]
AEPRPGPPQAVAGSPQPAVTPEQELRGQLATASQRLQPLLDENWQRFLALPSSVYEGNDVPSIEVLKETAARFDTVSRNPQYATLVQRPEFQTTSRLLSEYVNACGANADGPLNLPPPPSQQGGSAGAAGSMLR